MYNEIFQKMLNNLLFLPLFILLTFSFVQESKAQDAENSEAEVIAILMHADWCGTCKAIAPKVDNIKELFKDQAVLFTYLDVTDETTTRQAYMMAGLLGISEIVKTQQGRTGHLILINSETRELVGQLNNRQSVDEMRQTLEGVL